MTRAFPSAPLSLALALLVALATCLALAAAVTQSEAATASAAKVIPVRCYLGVKGNASDGPRAGGWVCVPARRATSSR